MDREQACRHLPSPPIDLPEVLIKDRANKLETLYIDSIVDNIMSSMRASPVFGVSPPDLSFLRDVIRRQLIAYSGPLAEAARGELREVAKQQLVEEGLRMLTQC